MSYKSKPESIPNLIPVHLVTTTTKPHVSCAYNKLKLSNGEYNYKCPWTIFWVIIASVITIIAFVYFLTLFYTLFLSPYK